jgi:hypothetical protein
VSTRCHLKEILRPEITSVLMQGGIIGGGEIDNNFSEKSSTWFLANTDVEYIKISR